MKYLLVTLAMLFVAATAAEAHEGIVDLGGSSAACKGVSIYQDGSYKVTGRCDGLVYPYETTYNRYVLWGKTEAKGEMIRIAEVDRGYFSGIISQPFSNVYVTAEQDSLARRPSTKTVASGTVEAFEFDRTTATPAPAATAAPAKTETTVKSTTTAGSIVGRILTSLLVIILVIVGLAIGASLIFRSRGSVSA